MFCMVCGAELVPEKCRVCCLECTLGATECFGSDEKLTCPACGAEWQRKLKAISYSGDEKRVETWSVTGHVKIRQRPLDGAPVHPRRL